MSGLRNALWMKYAITTNISLVGLDAQLSILVTKSKVCPIEEHLSVLSLDKDKLGQEGITRGLVASQAKTTEFMGILPNQHGISYLYKNLLGFSLWVEDNFSQDRCVVLT